MEMSGAAEQGLGATLSGDGRERAALTADTPPLLSQQ